MIRIKNKLLRLLVKSSFPNSVRVWSLKKLGIHVGDAVYVGEGLTLACVLGSESLLYIGDRVSIAPNVTIILTSDPNNSRLVRLKDKYENIIAKGKVIINDDVWLGAGSIIFPNVEIGEMSIIGAGSLVNRDVPGMTISAGVPSRIIRRLELKI